MKNKKSPVVTALQNELFQRAMALHRSGKLADAAVHYRKLLAEAPNNAALLTNLGTLVLQQGQFEEGIRLLVKSLKLNPGQTTALNNLGNACMALKRWEDALSSYNRAIAHDKTNAEAYSNRGNALKKLSRLHEALASYDHAINLNPNYAEACCNRGLTLVDLKRPDDALVSFEMAIAVNPGYADAYLNRGVLLKEQGRLHEALESYDRAIAINPGLASAYSNRGVTLKELNRLDDAIASYDRAIQLKPDYAEAYLNRGNACKQLNQLQSALTNYDRAIALSLGFAEAYSNRGMVLSALNRAEEAVANFKAAIDLNPGYADAHFNLGNAFKALNCQHEALASYDNAIAVNSGWAEAYSSRGTVLAELNRIDEALVSFQQALDLKPDCEFVAGNLLFNRLKIFDWRHFDNDMAVLLAKIQQGEKVAVPHNVLAFTDNPAIQKKAAEIWAAIVSTSQDSLPELPRYSGHNKIRLGYFSADFRTHAVAILSAGLFENHDRAKFEITAFSLGPPVEDDMRTRLMAAFDHFIDVQTVSDQEVAQLAAKLEIDIAIDLGGYTGNARAGIFAHRAAPVQVSYLGYAGTLGANCMDYLLADKVVIPEAGQGFYTEKIAYLPNSFLINDDSRKISDKVFSREDFGLPASGFVFCCFNNSYKITPGVFASWMRILAQVSESVLWLSVDDPAGVKTLTSAAGMHGIEGNRLVFAKRLPDMAEHLARLGLGDLFLDTLPYNAHTTACDALWAGVPVLTCCGESFASRVAASLLKAIELPELIAFSQAEYEALAIELATHPEKLAGIRSKLVENRMVKPLFDTRLSTRHIEAAYEKMFQGYQAGQERNNAGIRLLP